MWRSPTSTSTRARRRDRERPRSLAQRERAAGNGAGGFGASSQLDAGARAWSVTGADVDGDSQAGLELGLPGAAAVGVRLGRGDGTFAEQTNFTRGGGKPMDAQPLNVDGDGLLESLVGDGIPSFSVLRALPGVQTSGSCLSGRCTVHP